MSDEPNTTSQSWTVLTLKELLESRIDALDKRISVQHTADDLARQLASKNIDGRLEKLNELRDIVAANDTRYMTRETAEQRITRLESFQNKLVGLAIAVPIATSLVVYLLTN